MRTNNAFSEWVQTNNASRYEMTTFKATEPFHPPYCADPSLQYAKFIMQTEQLFIVTQKDIPVAAQNIASNTQNTLCTFSLTRRQTATLLSK
jgi:hypothetical protein